jgi:hypothetical protein
MALAVDNVRTTPLPAAGACSILSADLKHSGTVMTKKSAPARPGKKKKVVGELQRRTVDARKRAESAKKDARDAKQRARDARQLFKAARKVAKKARADLAALSKKLKKLLEFGRPAIKAKRKRGAA